jgi:hypothetical protein
MSAIPGGGRSAREIQAGLRNVLVDRVTAEVSGALDAAGIRSIVLKGPAIAAWLYEPDVVRGYGDSDLLVAHREWDRAIETLVALGFVGEKDVLGHPRMESLTSHPWRRGDDHVDLHATIEGLGAEPEAVWSALSRRTERQVIGGRELEVLGPVARTLHVALHAAQHQDGKPLLDLRRAHERLPESTWAQAAGLARELDGLPAFAAGLRHIDDGGALLGRLGLDDVRTADTTLRELGVPLAEGLHALSAVRGARRKLGVLRREVLPGREFMRWWSPLARRGRRGMLAAYLWRVLWLARHAPAAARAVRRARRDAR